MENSKIFNFVDCGNIKIASVWGFQPIGYLVDEKQVKTAWGRKHKILKVFAKGKELQIMLFDYIAIFDIVCQIKKICQANFVVIPFAVTFRDRCKEGYVSREQIASFVSEPEFSVDSVRWRI